MEQFKHNMITMFKYSDTQLYEFALSILMLVINPFHLLALRQCQALNEGSIRLLVVGTIIQGLCFGYGVVVNRLEIRFQMARVYWAYTLFTLVTLAPCGLTDEIGLVVSFVSQFVSSAFLLWRLGTERTHRRQREQNKLDCSQGEQ